MALNLAQPRGMSLSALLHLTPFDDAVSLCCFCLLFFGAGVNGFDRFAVPVGGALASWRAGAATSAACGAFDGSKSPLIQQ